MLLTSTIGTAGTLLVIPLLPPVADMVEVTEAGPGTCPMLSVDASVRAVDTVEAGTVVETTVVGNFLTL